MRGSRIFHHTEKVGGTDKECLHYSDNHSPYSPTVSTHEGETSVESIEEVST